MTDPDLSRSREAASSVVWFPNSDSTNSALLADAVASPQEWPDFSVLVTDTQTSGKGRLDRAWHTPPGTALAISVLLRPGVALEKLGWIPLLSGVAMTRTVRTFLAGAGRRAMDAELKWPNDVLVGGRKICGVLSELVATDLAVIVGAGLNTTMTAEQLPTEGATSLAVECGPHWRFDADEVLSEYLRELKRVYTAFTDAAGDAGVSGIHAEATAMCETLGRRVRVELPDSTDLIGIARGLDVDARLLVQPDGEAELVSVSAGDVTHLRPLDDAPPA